MTVVAHKQAPPSEFSLLQPRGEKKKSLNGVSKTQQKKLRGVRMDMTEYEREREERIRRNREQLSKLEVPVLVAKRPKVQKSAPASKRKKEEEAPPRRISLRSRGLAPDGGVAEHAEKAEPVLEPARKRHTGEETLVDISFGGEYDDFEGENLAQKKAAYIRKFLELMEDDVLQRVAHLADRIVEPDSVFALKLWGEGAEMKMTERRIYTLSWHPTTSNDIVAAGDNHGNFGLWRADGLEEPSLLQIEPHSSPITAIRVHLESPEYMYTSSIDANIRRLDLNKQVFTTVYEDKDEDNINDLQFIDVNTCAHCTRAGYVGIVDFRASQKLQREKQLHEKKIASLSLHTETNMLVTASNDCTVAIFDLRKIEAGNSLYVFEHKRAVSGAAVSPDGKRIVSTSYDDFLRVFEESDNGIWYDKPRKYKHDNNTGRWISSFRAEWHPFCPGVFVCGSKVRPHGVDLFNYEDGGSTLAAHLTSEYMTAIPARHAFHPQTGNLAMGTASGRVFLFSDSAI